MDFPLSPPGSPLWQNWRRNRPRFFCRAIDQPLAKLGELAANLRLDVIGEQRAAVFFRECNRCPAVALRRGRPDRDSEQNAVATALKRLIYRLRQLSLFCTIRLRSTRVDHVHAALHLSALAARTDRWRASHVTTS